MLLYESIPIDSGGKFLCILTCEGVLEHFQVFQRNDRCQVLAVTANDHGLVVRRHSAQNFGIVLVFLRSPEGKVFVIAEVDSTDADADDFAHEVALTRQNAALRELLAERSREPGKYTTDQVRQKLRLAKPDTA